MELEFCDIIVYSGGASLRKQTRVHGATFISQRSNQPRANGAESSAEVSRGDIGHVDEWRPGMEGALGG